MILYVGVTLYHSVIIRNVLVYANCTWHSGGACYRISHSATRIACLFAVGWLGGWWCNIKRLCNGLVQAPAMQSIQIEGPDVSRSFRCPELKDVVLIKVYTLENWLPNGARPVRRNIETLLLYFFFSLRLLLSLG